MRVQVFGILLCVGLIPIIFLFSVITNTYDTQMVSQRTDELQSYGTVVSNLVVSTGYLAGHSSAEVDNETEEIANIYQGRIIIVDKDLRILKDTYGLEENKTLISTEVVKCFGGSSEKKYVNDLGGYMQLTMPIVDPQFDEVCGVIVISYSVKNLEHISREVSHRVLFLLLGIALIIIILSFACSLVLTTPLKKVTDSINDISKGDMDIKLDMHGYSELVKISESFNQMTDVIRKQENSRQEFVSNVSHELKTPLASMKVLSDSLLTQEGMPEEIYREFLGDITTEIERMTKIINDLLSMVKMDKNSAVMQVANININGLLEQLLKRLRPIAAKRNIELVFESYRPVMADVDEVKISIALNNIIENAIKYNYDDGWVRVTLNADHKFFFVTVQDSGVGIPEDLQDNVFERFYRVDKARSRETGGTGLGLAITRNAILLHRGSIKLYSKEKEGTTFTIRIPLNYIP
ncbi:MAG TPA: two-component sensor histidine kinase [Lachnospiraceae bacterium]|nr:two-component sensor histidine kinase [Lachnospiraceae bacterium]